MIRSFFTSALMLLALCASAQADIKFAIGEPAEDSTRSGIGQISGWAVSDRQIVSVEAFIDGVSVGLVPYGGTRLDVAEAFPGYPDSEMSGWSMKWNYSLLSQGDHELTVVVTDIDGNQLSKSVSFATTGFTSEFIKDPEAVDISNAVVSTPEPGKILIRGAVVEGENVDIELCWDTATQQFQIERILRESAEKENQSPQANAGSSFDVEMAESVVINGMASDPDGSIVSWSWKQVAGNKVQLTDADQPTVKFTAPDTAGAIRLRLTVVDDGGASDSDDVVIEVIDSPSEPEPENLAPSADAGSDRTVEPGEVISVQGYASDTDGTIASWNWEVIAGAQVGLNNAHTDRVTFTALNEEGYTELLLTVTDDDGAASSDSVRITFEKPAPPPNKKPSANAGSNKTVMAGDTVTISGGANDTDGTVISYQWTQISGTDVNLSGFNNLQVQFTAPDAAGQIVLRLTVTDDDGATDSDDVTITVQVQAGSDPDPEPEPNDGTTGKVSESLLAAVNAARGQAQVCNGKEYPAQAAMKWDDDLATIAKIHSMDMASNGYFSHTSKDGTVFSDRVWPYWSGTRIGENLAASSVNRSDEQVVNMWLKSTSGHCELIMNPDFTHAGLGVGINTDNGYIFHYFWTLDIGG